MSQAVRPSQIALHSQLIMHNQARPAVHVQYRCSSWQQVLPFVVLSQATPAPAVGTGHHPAHIPDSDITRGVSSASLFWHNRSISHYKPCERCGPAAQCAPCCSPSFLLFGSAAGRPFLPLFLPFLPRPSKSPSSSAPMSSSVPSDSSSSLPASSNSLSRSVDPLLYFTASSATLSFRMGCRQQQAVQEDTAGAMMCRACGTYCQ